MTDVQAGSVSYQFKADIANFTAGMRQVNDGLKAAGDQAKQAMGSVSSSFKDAKAELDKHASSVSLNRMQWQELTAAMRHSFDAIAAGASPLRVLAMEGSKLSAVFSSGTGGVSGTLSAVASAINPLYLGMGALAAAVIGAGLAAKKWADDYRAMADAAKTAAISINDLYAMQKIAGSGNSGFDPAKGMVEFATALREAQMGGGELAKIMEKNGIAIKDAEGHVRNTRDVFADVSRLISSANNEIDKIKLAERFNLGPDAVKYMEEYNQAVKNGTVALDDFDKANIEAGRKSAQALDYLSTKWSDLKATVRNWAIAFIDAMSQVDEFDNRVTANIAGVWAGAIAAIKQMWAELVPALENFGKEAVNGLLSVVEGGVNAMIEKFNSVLETLHVATLSKIDLSSYKMELSKGAGDAGMTVGKAYSDAFGKAYDATFKAREAGRFKFTDAANDNTGNGGTKAINGLYDGADKVAKKLKEHVDHIKQFINGLKEATANAALEVQYFGQSKEQLDIALNLEKLRVAAKKQGREATAQERAEVIAQTTAYDQLQAKLEHLKEIKKAMADLASTIADSLDQWIVKGKSFGEVLQGLLSQLASMALRSILLGNGSESGGGGILGALFGGLAKVVGGREFGGDVGSGRAYVVGEKGPELFIPGASGSIVTNNGLKQAGQVQTANNNGPTDLHVHINLAGANGNAEIAAISKAATQQALSEFQRRLPQINIENRLRNT